MDKEREVPGEHITVVRSTPADGVGQALRSAFRGRLTRTPPEIRALLDKLR